MHSDVSAPSGEYQLCDQERLSLALQAAQVGTWELDVAQQLVWLDKRCRDLYGLTDQQSISYSALLEFIYAEDRNRVEEAVERALRPGSLGHYEVEFRTLNPNQNKLRWLYCKGQAFFNEKGQVYRFSGIAQDITSLIQTRQLLAYSENHWRNLVDSSATATAIYQGRDMTIQAVNQAMITIWGKDASVQGKTFAEAIPEVEDQPFLSLLQNVYDTGIAYHEAEGKAILRVDGRLQEFWFNYSYAPLREESGKIYGIIHTATDITSQVQARRALEVQQQQFKAMLEGSLLLKCLLDPKGSITFQNQRFGEYTGFTLEQSQRKGWQSLFSDQDYRKIEKIASEGIRTQKGFTCESRLRRHDGEYCWHEIEFVPLFDGNQQLTGWVCRATNIHERKNLQHHLEYLVQERTEELEASLEELQALNEELGASNEELQASGEELSESNQQLSLSNDRLQRFAYVASHDLQEPLRKIQTFGSLLSQRYGHALGDQGLSLLTRMSKAGEQMSTLIQDLLAYSRISGQGEQFQVVSLHQVLTSVTETLEISIEQTQAIIEIDALPAILGDEGQLGQLFQNLLSNAIKFAKPGERPHIRITTQIRLREQLPSHVEPLSKADRFHQVSVIDRGVGFNEQFLDRIFEVFQRLHDKKIYNGTGIGLAICQRVMENHGGAITAESIPEEGARFHVYFPY